MRTTDGDCLLRRCRPFRQRRRQGAFEKQARRGLSALHLPGHQHVGRLRADQQREGADVVGRQGVVDAHQPRFARLPARLAHADLFAERGAAAGRTRAGKPPRRIAQRHFDRDLSGGGRVVAHFDVELHAPLRAGRVAIDPQDRQIRQRLGRGGRFELDVRVGRQRREVGLRPGGALEIAHHDQLPPAMVVLRRRGQHAGGQVERPIHVDPLRQRRGSGPIRRAGRRSWSRARRRRLAAARPPESDWPPAPAGNEDNWRPRFAPARSARRRPIGRPCSG